MKIIIFEDQKVIHLDPGKVLYVYGLKGKSCCGREIELWKKLSQSDWERLITIHLRIVVCCKVLESPN